MPMAAAGGIGGKCAPRSRSDATPSAQPQSTSAPSAAAMPYATNAARARRNRKTDFINLKLRPPGSDKKSAVAGPAGCRPGATELRALVHQEVREARGGTESRAHQPYGAGV